MLFSATKKAGISGFFSASIEVILFWYADFMI
jgi:hypothetical protein